MRRNRHNGAAVVTPSFIIILLITALLKTALKNPYVQAVLRGVKPCMAGIILATGVFMMLRGCFVSGFGSPVSVRGCLLTAALAGLYFGSRRLKRFTVSPIGLIGISAAAGLLVFGL